MESASDVQSCTQIFIFANAKLFTGLGGVNLLKMFLLSRHKMSRAIQESHVVSPPPPWGWDQFANLFFARYCMKYPDVHRKVNPYSS